MSRTQEALIASTLAVSLSVTGCTASEKPEPTPASSFEATVSTKHTPVPEALPPFMPDATAGYMGTHAPIHIIYGTVPHRLPEPFANYVSKTTRRELQSKSSLLREEISHEFRNATHGRYSPSSVTIYRASSLALNTCITDPANDKEAQMDVINKWAAPYEQKGAINVIVVDQVACGADKLIGVAGYASDNQAPILNATSFTKFPAVVAHEVGHEAGLDHAGTLACANIPSINNCKAEETADPTSLMSYTFPETSRYSIVELAKMGMLNQSEILPSPRPGIYNLTDLSRTGIKLIELLDRKTGEPVYLTLEPDDQAAYDRTCLPDKDIKSVPDNRLLDASTIYVHGKEVNVTCFKTHLRNLSDSLQIRTEAVTTRETPHGHGQTFLGLVERADRAPDISGPELSTGEVIPGKVIYDDAVTRVVLESIGKHMAKVRITKA